MPASPPATPLGRSLQPFLIQPFLGFVKDRFCPLREIGILQAIGASRATIFAIFFLESGLYGLLGGIIGMAGGVLFSLLASPYISQNEFTSLIKGSDLAEAMDAGIIGGSILFSIAVSLGSGLYPAWKAARMTPVEAISYE